MNQEHVMVDAKRVKALAKVAFPEYRGRKFKVVEQAAYSMANYWDGGSRSFCVAVELATGRIVEAAEISALPWARAAHATVTIPAGWAILDHSIFCGHDCGITLYVAPAAALPDTATTAVLPAFESMSQIVEGGLR